jgi:hypothetical protein
MINFFVTGAASFCIREYLQMRGAAIADRVNVVEYEELGDLTALPAGPVVFAAVDQIGRAAADAAAQICDRIAGALGPRAVLNDPRKVLRRFDLLSRLHEGGGNRFKTIRAVDDPCGLRYPVFIREEDQHSGSLTPLLGDRWALERALGEMVFRGLRPSRLLIVEFCDTSGPDGLFRKYSAMKIGDVILPRHLHISREWVTKSNSNVVDETALDEELTFFEQHPHERWLRQVFETAQIQYGRIDYGIFEGAPQVWEINTNPTLGRRLSRGPRAPGDALGPRRERNRALAHQWMLEAFRRLDSPPDTRSIPIVVDAALQKRLQSEFRRIRRWATVATVHRAFTNGRLRPLLDRVRPALGPIAPAVARLTRHH